MAEYSGNVFKNANVGDIVKHKNHNYMVVYKDINLARDFVIKHTAASKGEPIKRVGRRSLIDQKYGEHDIVITGYRVNNKIAKKIDDGRFYKMIVISDLGTVYTIDFNYELKADRGDLWSMYVEKYNELNQRAPVRDSDDFFKINEKILKHLEDVLVVVPTKPMSEKSTDQNLLHWTDEMLRKVRYNERDQKVEELIAMLKNPKAAEDLKDKIETRKELRKHTKREYGHTYVDYAAMSKGHNSK